MIKDAMLSRKTNTTWHLKHRYFKIRTGNNSPTSNVASNFLCEHKICFVQHFTSTHLSLEQHVRNMCKNISRRNIYVCSRFSCVCSRPVHVRKRTHAAQLRGNIAYK